MGRIENEDIVAGSLSPCTNGNCELKSEFPVILAGVSCHVREMVCEFK